MLSCNICMSIGRIHHYSLLDHREFPQRLQTFSYLPFPRTLNCILLVLFDLTSSRYVPKNGKAWTLKMPYTGFVSLWKLQVILLIRSETHEIMSELCTHPVKKKCSLINLNLGNINLRFLLYLCCFAFSSCFCDKWLMTPFVPFFCDTQ